MAEKWIQKAIKKPGALKKQLVLTLRTPFRLKLWPKQPRPLAKWANVRVLHKL